MAQLPVAQADDAPPGRVLVEAARIGGDGKTARAEGDVRACFGRYVLQTESLFYDRENDLLRAPHSFELSIPALQQTMRGGAFSYRPLMREGEAADANILIGEEGLRASGEMILLRDGFFSVQNAEISSCKAESPDWILRAESAKWEGEAAEARGIWLYARDAPVLYFPVLRFRTSREKRGGFLPPEAEYSDASRGRVKFPYYFFLAPNYDATITPEWFGKHGALLGGEFRYLTPAHRGEARLHWSPGKDGNRARQEFSHEWETGDWRFRLAADNVSDGAYFADFADDSALLARRNLPRRAEAEYARGGWSGRVLLESFKTIAYSGAPPHDVLPQLQLRHDGGAGGFSWDSEWEYARFVAPSAALPEGGRWLWRGGAGRRFNWRGAAIIPESGAHAAKYSGGAAFITPFARLRAESGYRPLPGAEEGNYQLRFVYAYAPETNQHAAPLYDTALREFSAGGIYDWNRFSGGDRAADASVAAYGADIFLWDNAAGRERLALEFAQRFYFRRPRLTLPQESPPPRRGFSNLYAALRANISGRWKAEANAEWSPEQSSFESVYADARADFGGRRLLRAGGLFEENESLVLGGAHPFGARADFSFLFRYLLDDDRFAESDAALAVRGECGCWKLFLHRRDALVGEEKNKISYSIGLELTGLGKIGGNGYEKITADLR